jgi:hypothetical protein
MAIQVLESLAHLVYLNSEFNILIYIICSKALRPYSIVEHIRKFYTIEPKVRKELEVYIKANFQLLDDYKYDTIRLSANGSAPQAILPIVDGFQC